MDNLEKDYRLFARDHRVSGTMIDNYGKMLGAYISPTVTEERKLNVAQMDVFSRLFMDRILFLGTAINDEVANIVNSQLLFLKMENPNKPVDLYINSPGGSVYDGMSIYDVMNLIDCPVRTTCCGTAASMAAVLLSAGEKGERRSLAHSKIMIHQPSGGAQGPASDIYIAAKEMEKCQDMLYRVLAENMGKDYDYVKRICDRDYWLTPDEAVAEGVIDMVINKNK